MSSLFSFSVFLLFLSTLSSSSSTFDLFEKWCLSHNKTYSSDQEKLTRLKIFEENYAYISQHNNLANSSYVLSLNAFADLTHQEFRASKLGLSGAGNGLIRMNHGSMIEGSVEIPSSLDWREKGAVTNVKDQGSCGMSVFQSEDSVLARSHSKLDALAHKRE